MRGAYMPCREMNSISPFTEGWCALRGNVIRAAAGPIKSESVFISRGDRQHQDAETLTFSAKWENGELLFLIYEENII